MTGNQIIHFSLNNKLPDHPAVGAIMVQNESHFILSYNQMLKAGLVQTVAEIGFKIFQTKLIIYRNPK